MPNQLVLNCDKRMQKVNDFRINLIEYRYDWHQNRCFENYRILYELFALKKV